MHEYVVITCIPHAQCVGRKVHVFIIEQFVLVHSCALFKVQPDVIYNHMASVNSTIHESLLC